MNAGIPTTRPRTTCPGGSGGCSAADAGDAGERCRPADWPAVRTSCEASAYGLVTVRCERLSCWTASESQKSWMLCR